MSAKLSAAELLDFLLKQSNTLCLLLNDGVITQVYQGYDNVKLVNNQYQLFKELAILDKTLTEVLPKALAKIFAEQLPKLNQRNSYLSFDFSHQGDNKPYYYQTKCYLLNAPSEVLLVVRTVEPHHFIAKSSSNELHQQVFENNQAIKLILDPKTGSIVDANEAAARFYGYSQAQLQTMNIAEINQLSPEQVKKELASAEREDRLYFNFVHQLASGECRDVEVYSGPITLANSTLLYSIIHDVTERKKAERKLLETEKRQRDMLNNTSSLIYYKHLDGRYISVNKAFEQAFGLTEADLLDKTDYDVMPRAAADVCRDADLRALSADAPLENEETVLVNGVEHTYISVKFPLKDADGKNYAICGISTDITERKQAERRIIQQAHYDNLTQLPNRFLALDRLNQLLKDAKRNKDKVAVLFLDLDDFKKVNDTLGHEFGDKLLVEAAARLTKVIRKSDTVGRLGGDEFIILLKGLTSAEHVQPVADNLINEFRRPFVIENRELLLTSSIGIALYPDDASTSSNLLRNADTAMYHAKSIGRNTYAYYTKEMNQDVARRLLIEEQIRNALEKDEFEVYFQPQFSVKNKRLVGAEALLRWHNPSLGNVSPAEFIPVAEQTGLIVPIGRYVIEQSLATLAKWQKLQPDLDISVNVSPRQFRDNGLVNFLAQMIKQNGIDARHLELEITEGVLMTGHKSIEQDLLTIGQMGVKLAMDDFGTGYSSLSYLRKYPFNVLKIDRSFVSNLSADSTDLALIKATVAMADALGVKVIAEGVETQGQFALLHDVGCDYIQGYLFGKPCQEAVFVEQYLTSH
ncbi:EAL domain-containing protein [Endozoicomonas sp. G2_1]|uniref:sensor domain-containing protein n=1 Tax=Endozoicomonas sp. G2_1 TaxID=2821091 RepID=UPI001ADB81AD|nr:bifunctional diguanylate cyclase/phosphodiesterase [Endozoicomonas sp. G2_1]MBO9491865.1 EAL domain-containing protein [Endozoicomonas sp. G2_1]